MIFFNNVFNSGLCSKSNFDLEYFVVSYALIKTIVSLIEHHPLIISEMGKVFRLKLPDKIHLCPLNCKCKSIIGFECIIPYFDRICYPDRTKSRAFIYHNMRGDISLSAASQ